MKKFAIASVLAMAAVAASAVEVGVTTTTDYSSPAARQGFGVTVGQQYGAIGVTAGVERFTKGANDQTRLSLTAGYDVAKFGPVTITPTVGVAHLDNQTAKDGYALAVGLGASVPVAKNVAFTVAATRQYGQHRVEASNGNAVTAGVKYAF